MSHFGEWISAYVDGELSTPRSERLMMHTAQCKECAIELESVREARRALLSVPDAEPSPDLTARLMRATSGEMGPENQRPRRESPAELQPETGADRTYAALTGEVRRPRRTRRVLLTAGLGVGAVLIVLGTLGAPTLVTPDLSEIEALTVLSGGQARESMVRQVDLGQQDDPIMVREQAGKLATEDLDAVATTRIADRTVFVLSVEPLHLVWQSSDIVVDLVAAGQTQAVTEVIEHYPNHSFPSGFEHQIARGWATLTGASADA